MNAREERLRETLDALASISRRLVASLEEEATLFPLSAARVASKDASLEKSLDAFLQRFTQTLDQTLRKLFPRLQAAITASDELLTIRELLDGLHRATVITDVQSWLELIEVRNRLTHEYALDAEERASALNDAWMRAQVLLDQIERARSFAIARRLIDGDVE